jgi:hypothetical protein
MPQSAMDVTLNSEYQKCLVVGLPGTGKSVFASTFPTPGYVFDFSLGIQIYRGLPWDYEQFPLSPAGWNKFDKELAYVKNAVKERKYETVVIDDWTAMERVTMEQALLLNPKRSEAQGPIWNVHYSLVRNLFEGKIRQVIDLPCNVVLLAHMEIITDKESGAVLKIQPSLPGQLPDILNGYFDEDYYATTRQESGGTKFLLQTVPIGHNRARSRWSGKARLLPDFIDNDYPALMNAMKKKQQQLKTGGK